MDKFLREYRCHKRQVPVAAGYRLNDLVEVVGK